MIPVNDAIATAVTAVVLAALIVLWACRGYWKTATDDAYQDGHAAGIQTQISRQQLAVGRHRADDRRILDAYLERTDLPRPDEPATEIIMADLTRAPAAEPARQLAQVIPFPQGLPPGLREYAAATLAAAYDLAEKMLP